LARGRRAHRGIENRNEARGSRGEDNGIGVRKRGSGDRSQESGIRNQGSEKIVGGFQIADCGMEREKTVAGKKQGRGTRFEEQNRIKVQGTRHKENGMRRQEEVGIKQQDCLP
jgi:hypothetical protein